jgi:hypothetical protein
MRKSLNLHSHPCFFRVPSVAKNPLPMPRGITYRRESQSFFSVMSGIGSREAMR